MKRNVILAVILLTELTFVIGVFAQNTVLKKQPVANDASGLYFINRLGVYIFIPRDCGFIGCFGPDLRLTRYKKIPRADPATFEIIVNPKGSGSSTAEILARDKNHVFYGGEFIPTGDVNTLQVVGEHAKDKNNVYFGGQVIAGLDSNTVQFPGGQFIADRYGLYLGNSSPPRKAALVDYPSFKFLPRTVKANGKYFVAEDKNFNYYSDGGGYQVDSKPDTPNFRKLGCGYYYFGGRIYYSVYELDGADAASFRVLGNRESTDTEAEQNANSCSTFYAIDKDRRYEFGLRVRPDDTYRNHRIDLLLATLEDRKRMSEVKHGYVCIPESSPGVNFGFSNSKGESTMPGTIKFLHYLDAGILETQLIDANRHWQSLPTIKQEGMISGCNSIGVQKFWEGERKPWFSRRDSNSISLTVNQFGQDPVFVVADSRYSIRLVFSKTALTQLLRERLRDSKVTPFENDVGGWGSGWILENKFFIGRDQIPEVWVPLKLSKVITRYVEGQDFVTVGFRFSEGQFECIDLVQCGDLGIPQKFKADFALTSTN